MVDNSIKNREQNRQDSQLRKHYFLNQYVIVAPGRSQRPQQLDSKTVSQKDRHHHPIEDEPSLFEITDKHDQWQVKVVANGYPAVTVDNPEAPGTHEVVLETPRINTAFGELSVPEIKQVLQAYQQRVHILRQRHSYVSVFKNHGWRAGASLAHTHSQILAIDFIPPQILTERQHLTEYQFQHNTSALCDVVRWELEQDQRVIAHTRYTTTVCPYASQYPLETWVVPNRQSHSIVDLSDDELQSLADHLKGVTLALSSNGMEFNYHLQEGIANEYNHFYIKVTPRIAVRAGFELNTGISINPVSPEYARNWYQKHVKTPDAV